MAAPFLVASHKLVAGLKSEVLQPNTKTQDPANVTNMLKKLVSECSSDVYLILNIPGLEAADMLQSREENWPHLVKYLHMASSVVGLPWMEGLLDLHFLEKYITRTCATETINVVLESDDEVVQYLDTRKRIIKVEFNPLPPPGPERQISLRENDDLIRRILRKVPLPHYTIIVTLTVMSPVHPIPQFALEETPEQFELFHSIVNDERREEEVERNNYLYADTEPVWNENMDAHSLYLARKKKDQIHFFNHELWKKNEKLVTTVAVMVASVFLVQTISVVKWVQHKIAKPKRT